MPRKRLVCSLLCLLWIASPVHAADNFFWSEAVPMPSCYQSRDGAQKEMGVVIDGQRVQIDLPSCEEALKNRVLVRVNGKYLHMRGEGEAAPFIENGRTMIPLRAMADAFGFQVEWEQSERKITLTKDGKQIVLYIGKPEMSVDGQSVLLTEAVPMMKHNVTFLPVRPLAEIIGSEVEWDAGTRTATFTAK